MSLKEGFTRLIEDARSRIQEVEVDEAAELIAEGDCFVIDVREKDEYFAGHIPGALHFSRGVVEMKLPDAVPDTSALILCYCGTGGRAALVADNLQKMGYINVLSIAGGYKAWVDDGRDVDQ